MKFLTLLPLAALVLAPAAFAAQGMPSPYPESGLFAPIGAIPIVKGHLAWDARISVEAKGLPLRAVLAAALEAAKVPYAVDPSLELTIYASLQNVTLREAVNILSRHADFEVRAESGIWYATRRKPKAKIVSVVRPVRVLSGTIASQTILVDATPRSKSIVPMRVTPPVKLVRATVVRTVFPVGMMGTTKPVIKIVKKTVASKLTLPKLASFKPALGRRVTTKLPKTDLRVVFESLSQQTGVPITVDETVPRYKIDAYMNGCSLKYALDRLCQAAGLKYAPHGSAIRISKAS